MTDRTTSEHDDPHLPRKAPRYPGGTPLFERLLEQARDSGDGRAHHSAPNPNDVETLIDRMIEQARAEGAFDNLPGAGKPLAYDDDALIPDDMRAGFRLLKNAGYAPLWIEARRDIDAERARIAAWLHDANRRWSRLPTAIRARLRTEYHEMLTNLQRQIIAYNLTAPPAAGQIEGVYIAEEMRKLGE
ncbi:MAG: DnaJ family domain-containing protein [Roseiflexus sp.]